MRVTMQFNALILLNFQGQFRTELFLICMNSNSSLEIDNTFPLYKCSKSFSIRNTYLLKIIRKIINSCNRL